MTTRSKGRACDGKQRHNSRDAAHAQLVSLVRKRGANRGSYEPYACRHCKGWHGGHRAERGRKP